MFSAPPRAGVQAESHQGDSNTARGSIPSPLGHLPPRHQRFADSLATWEMLAMPVLYGVGSKWEETGRYVEVEHLLSWSVSSALRRVPEPIGGAERVRPVVLACMPHEMHSLPAEALAAALREAGLPRRVLGP